MQDKTEHNSDIIFGRNPVLEALKAGTSIECIYLHAGNKSGSMLQISRMAKEKAITVKEVTPQKLDQLSGRQNHQGIAALISQTSYMDIDELLEKVHTANEYGFLVIADEIEDPHNLGAIIRTCEACGVDGVIVPKRRSAPISSVAYKASAGACNYVNIAKVANLASVIDKLKQKGYWIYGADMDGQTWCQADFSPKSNIALVIGSEGKGLGRLVKQKCDGILSLPMLGQINSLNASVAAGILLYEIMRQRNAFQAHNL